MALDEEWDESGLVGKVAAGRYLIVSELATDNRRTLYEAENVELGVRVTLGVVRADGTNTDARLEKGHKLRALNQPGLVTILDVGTLDSGDLYVATERPAGRTLREVAGGKRLEPRRALLIIRQVLEALSAAHAVGAVHGDIKPEHVTILPGLGDDRVKVTDFAVAALTGTRPIGDPVYTAPESAFGSIDERADLYSTGAVLFELLTGHPPFFADDPDALRRLHAYAPMQTLKQRVPDVSFADLIETVVATALEKKRDARYQSANDMIAAVDRALDALEQTMPPAPGERTRDQDASLMLLAQELMPKPPAAPEPLVPNNVAREVPKLSLPTRAQLALRRGLSRLLATRFGRALQAHRKPVALAAGALGVLVLVIAIARCGGDKAPRKVAPPPSAEDPKAYLERGRVAMAKGHEDEAMTAYERAFRFDAALASDAHVIDAVNHLASSKDADVRHRAFALADHRGFAAKLDRVPGWLLDLEQATDCDEQKAAIGSLAGTGDRRALPALQKAKAQACVEADATAAIQRISKSAH